MGLRDRIKPTIFDWMLRSMDGLRPETVSLADGDVLEVGFGTGLNIEHYPAGVSSLTGLDPGIPSEFAKLEDRVARAPFPVERHSLAADRELPFDSGRFDCVVTTWTLCSIPEPRVALAEMRRVLKPGGRYVFVEHGRGASESLARWQDRINPLWVRLADGCNLNRAIDQLVEEEGFELESLDRFRHKGPALVAQMYRGVARKAG